MKKPITGNRLLTVVLAGAFSLASWAANFTSGGIKYTTITEPDGATNGTCKVAWQTQGIEGEITIPDDVTYSGKTYDVVEIADYAFNAYDYEYDIEITALHVGDKVKKIGRSCCADQVYLTDLTLGAAVETIGASAFSECAIKAVEIPAGVKKIADNTFYNNMSLRSVILHEGLESIGSYAFYKVNNLTSIDIPSTVTSIAFETRAFGDCLHLEAMNVAQGNPSYMSVDGVVYDAQGTTLIFCPIDLSVENLSFPENLATIGNSAFKGNKNLKALNFPAALTEIGPDAFSGCSAIESLVFPASLRILQEYAFNECASLKSVTLNDGLETVANAVFKKCPALAEINIPASVTSFSWSAIYGCTGLTKITVDKANTAYTSDGVALIETATGSLLAYAAASDLKFYKVPDNVKEIASFAFNNVGNLEVIDFNKTSVVGNDAVAIMPALTDVALGSSTSSLENGAFSLCPNLKTARINCSMPPSSGDGTRTPFPADFAANGTLYVPDNAVAIYKTDSYWREFANILPISQAPELNPGGGEEPNPESPLAHAYSLGSKTGQFGFVEFPVNDVDAMKVVKATAASDDQIGAAEYVDGKIYAYTLTYDFIFGDGLEPSEFVVYDAANYTSTRTATPDLKGRVVDMAYDYVHNTMYALVEENRTDNGAIGLTALNVVDLATGNVTIVGLPGDIKAQNGIGQTVDEHLIALAARPSDGQLFAMGEYRQLYMLDRMTGAATPVGARNKIAINNDFQAMAFDADDNLYQVQCHPDYEYFMRIDTATGQLYNPTTGEAVVVNSDFTNTAARVPNDAQLSGLYFTDIAFSPAAPKAVTALNAEIAEGKPNTVALSWTLPTENFDGTAASIVGVDVYRFGTAAPIASLDASAVGFTDPAAPNGTVSYCVVARSASAAGFPAWTSIFAGADQLKAVADLKAELDGDQAVITWTAPSATVNGGYADYDAISYSVTMVKGEVKTLLKSDLTETTYTAQLPENGTYSFIVTPTSCGVEGLPAQSNSVTLQGIEQLPYACGFGDDDGGTLWTIVNTSTGSYGWSIIAGYAYQQLDGKFAQFKTGGSATMPADDWFISPAISCPAGKYRLTYYANGGSYDTHYYKVFMGANSVEPAAFTQEIYSLQGEKVYDADNAELKNYLLVSVDFSLAEDGDYRIGFQGIGESTFSTLKIDNLRLECTELSGIGQPTSAEASIAWDAATRSVICPEAIAIDAYDVAGRHLGHADGDSLRVSATGLIIVKATAPDGSTIAARVLAR